MNPALEEPSEEPEVTVLVSTCFVEFLLLFLADLVISVLTVYSHQRALISQEFPLFFIPALKGFPPDLMEHSYVHNSTFVLFVKLRIVC